MSVRFRNLAAGAIASAALLVASRAFAGAPPMPHGTSALTPEAIYLRAVHAMKSAPVPPYVTFREHIVGRNMTLSCTSDGINIGLRHGDVTAAYDVYFRTRDGSAISRAVANPSATASPCPGALLQPAGAGVSAMGVPDATASSPATDAASASTVGPPIIAAVRVDAALFYHIELVGRERLSDNEVYHLKLTAYRDPHTHPLTDLYVDPETFLVREARGEVSGHYVVGSGRFGGIVDFGRVGDYWLVEHEHFDLAANALFVHARINATVDGSNFTTPSELPGIVFPTPQPTASPKTTPSPHPTASRSAV